MTDTIYAPSTVLGKSGVAIIRISGARACEVLAYFSLSSHPTPRYAYYADFRVGDTIIDSGVYLYFQGPHSFTGEDVVEFHCHGSIAVVQSMLDHLAHIPGLRVAEPGEFSRRAFDNGKMDLTQAEGLADLIESETEAQRQQALRQMQGELGHLYDSWRSQLIDIIAFLEAYIDFPDEDLPDSLIADATHQITSLMESLRNHMADNRVGERLRSGIQAVILGPPNAGKSSFINMLAKSDIAIVSEQAGTTRDIVEAHTDMAGIPVTFVDTAGLRETEDPIEQEGIARALSRHAHADIRILLFDAREIPTHTTDIAASLVADSNADEPFICVNKMDVENDFTLPAFLAERQVFPLSLHDNTGIDALLDALTARVQQLASLTQTPTITRTRHREALQECIACLDAFSFDQELVLALEDLRLAAQALGRITGRIGVEDVLDALFSHFCIGK